jgi:hypothetical protein
VETTIVVGDMTFFVGQASILLGKSFYYFDSFHASTLYATTKFVALLGDFMFDPSWIVFYEYITEI